MQDGPIILKLHNLQSLDKAFDFFIELMKKVNKQGLFDTPHTVRVSGKT